MGVIIDLSDVAICVYDLNGPAMGDAEDRTLAYAVDAAHRPVLILASSKLTAVQIDKHFRPI